MFSSLQICRWISTVCAKCFFFQLRQLRWVRRTLDDDSIAILVHTFVTSRIDYYISLLAGAPKTSTDKLQRVINAAARIISNTRKFDRGLTPLRRDVLHWLDVTDRITFRLCSRLSVLTVTRHCATVPVRTVSVVFRVWRTSSSTVFGPQSTRHTSLPSCNHR